MKSMGKTGLYAGNTKTISLICWFYLLLLGGFDGFLTILASDLSVDWLNSGQNFRNITPQKSTLEFFIPLTRLWTPPCLNQKWAQKLRMESLGACACWNTTFSPDFRRFCVPHLVLHFHIWLALQSPLLTSKNLATNFLELLRQWNLLEFQGVQTCSLRWAVTSSIRTSIQQSDDILDWNIWEW